MIRTSLLAVCLLFSLQLAAQNVYLQPIARNNSQKTTFLSAKITPAGDLLAASGMDRSVKIFDPATLTEKTAFLNGNLRSFSIVFTNDGKNIIVSLPDGNISVWDIGTLSIIKTFSHGTSVRCLDIDPSGRVISGGYDKIIKMWDYTKGVQTGKFPAISSEITALSFSPDGKIIVAAGSDGGVTVFDANTPGMARTNSDKRFPANAIIFSPDGKYFAASHMDSTITLWNGRNGTPLSTWKSTTGAVTSVAFHPTSKYVISASSAISFWDVVTGKNFQSVTDTAFSPMLLSVSPQRNILAAVSRSGEIRTFQMLDKKPDVTAPDIIVKSPQTTENEPAKVFSSEIEVTGIVSDESAIKEVRVNDAVTATLPASLQERGSMAESFSAVTFSVAVPLPVAGKNSIMISATDAENNTSTQELKVTKLSKDAAVEMVNPKESIETDQIALDLQFKVWFDFSSYSIQLNTIEIAKKENFPKKPNGMLRTEKLSLSAGLNQIQLTVNGRGGEKIRKTINITRRMLGAPTSIADDKPLKNTSGQPQRWAVVVGVSEYGNPAIKNLAYADRDARAFAEFLKTSAGGGFEEERVKILLNKEATLQNVKQALFNFLRQTVDKDLVVIYFAGHGAPEPANPNNNYLLCYDTDPRSLETSAFPMWDVNTALTRYIPSKRVVVFTDACHSGGISSDIATRGMSTTDGNLINQYLADLSKTKEGIIVFTASQAGEVSQELEKFGHGVFTYFLLQGMKGEADFNNDYTVTIGELMDYVEEKVKRQTNGNQHPTRNQGTYDKDLTISLIPN
jgi:hypothetical protein